MMCAVCGDPEPDCLMEKDLSEGVMIIATVCAGCMISWMSAVDMEELQRVLTGEDE